MTAEQRDKPRLIADLDKFIAAAERLNWELDAAARLAKRKSSLTPEIIEAFKDLPEVSGNLGRLHDLCVRVREVKKFGSANRYLSKGRDVCISAPATEVGVG